MGVNSFLACDCKTFVGKFFLLPSNVLVFNQGVGNLRRVLGATVLENQLSILNIRSTCEDHCTTDGEDRHYNRNQCAGAQLGKLSTLL